MLIQSWRGDILEGLLLRHLRLIETQAPLRALRVLCTVWRAATHVCGPVILGRATLRRGPSRMQVKNI
jgi:hypothetical protein